MIKFLQTPSRTKKIVLGGLLLIICIAMVITLIPGGFLGDALGFGSSLGQGVLAKVGDQEVTYLEAQQTARMMVRERFPKGAPSQLMPYFLQQAVQELVMQKAMLVEAERLGLRIDDAELADFLQHGELPGQTPLNLGAMFFPNGQFIGQEQYEDLVERAFNMSVPQFEAALKTELLLRKLRNVVQGGVTVSDEQLRQEYLYDNAKVKFAYVVLTLDDVAKQIKPAEAELKAYYDKNKNNYANAIPEKRKVQYVFISDDAVKAQVQVTPDDLKSYYNQHLDAFRVPDEVKVRHIFIKLPAPGPDGQPDAKGIEAARAKAEDVLKQLRAGKSFEELAKKYSEDPGSAKDGGELGWIGRGRMAPEFEQAAFSLKPGETSGLVQSSYGFHIIQVEDKRTAHLQTLDEVKSKIEPSLVAQRAAQKAETLANAVESQARAPGALQATAHKNGLELLTTPLVSRNDTIPVIGQSPEFVAAVFSARPNSAPEMVRLPNGYAILQVLEVKPPQTPSFEEIKSRVEEDFRHERSGELLTQKLQELSDRAHASHDVAKAAAEVGATVKTSDLVKPDQQVPDIGSLAGSAAVVFDMKPGEISSPIQVPQGGAVVSLLERQEADLAGFDGQKEQIREKLLTQKRDQMLNLFVDSLQQRLEKEGKIRINRQEMERLMPKSEAS